jgi:hypothetical protein
MMRKVLFLAGCTVFLMLSCSRSEPRIAYGTMRMVYFEEEDSRTERFSFFVLPEDDDGLEDIADLYLYHDREGLAWHLSAGDWVAMELEGKTWVGSRSLAMLDGEALPRGQFRAVLVDKGGEKSERVFGFDAPELPRHPFPRLSVENGLYRIESSYPRHFFICYDEEGNYLRTQEIANLEGALAELGLTSNTRAAALWAEDPEYFSSALTNLLPLR